MSQNSYLSIKQLELNVNLGWRDQERRQEQAVLLDVDIYYAAIPKACETDDLTDTVCYADLIEKIHQHTRDKKYKLVEHLSADLYQLIKSQLSMQANIVVRVTKYPKLKGLTGGVCFHYGDQ